MKVKLVVIAGPTACGKTRLGVDLAHRLGSEIVSADSRQVYRGLDIGTGKDLDEYSRVDPPVPCHLIDLVDPGESFSLYHYQQACYRLLARKAVEEPFASGTPLVMVGGTGLYIEAVLRAYRLPNVPEDPALREALEAEPLEELVRRLEAADRELFARTEIANKRRVIRALEIAAHGREHEVVYSRGPAVEVDYRVFAVHPDRAELYRWIGERVRRRLDEGMIEEVEGLVAAGLDRRRLEWFGMEYRQIAAYLWGDKSREQMVEDLEQAIRNLAKRQLTWLRGMGRRGIAVRWIAPGDLETVLEAVGSWS
ncbi:MAG: tRNA (adenosine(37)-N6)-dimethylallyltransferase MiaA [Acidobacteriota bacterium]|nr:tRNA (adenosine(37)-N6)-dimethylallyltransferase MiaA [Acidobacteriota bacterium]MDQ7088945.1 tRNA (adenosine(37)-N6)-dimethylallyltransferase MiaA [Acidobacteriota bacterium]